MKEKYIIFPSLDIKPAFYFWATDEEIKELEAREEARAEELKAVIFAPDFLGAEYISDHGSREILHHSTRDGVLFQLSYIAADGVPTMHENFIKTYGVNQEIVI